MSIETRDVVVSSLRLDGGTQPRTEISEATITNYAEHMAGLGPKFPAIVVFFDGVDSWLADGFHRVHAARRIGRESLAAIVHTGTKRDAVLFAAGANQDHGLQRTNADKRKAVLTLLQDPEWGQWALKEIARRCGVSDELALSVKRAHYPETDSDTARTYTTKHGTTATMHTENIGKLKMPDRSRAAVAQRRQDVKDMAERGYTTPQIAASLGVDEGTIGLIAKRESVVIHADRVMGKTRRPEANRIVEQMVLQAESLVADIGLIDFDALDAAQFADWLTSLKSSREALGVFIRRLMKEQQKHVEAA